MNRSIRLPHLESLSRAQVKDEDHVGSSFRVVVANGLELPAHLFRTTLDRGRLIAFMPQFVIEREIKGAGSLSEAEIREVSLRSLETLQAMGPQIQWLHSYVTEDKVYCVYLAPDENSIREHARRAGIPADRVSAVRRLIDPAKLQ